VFSGGVMKNGATIAFIILLIISSSGLAGNHEITRLIEVGPASHMPMAQPLKWSPEGNYLSYFFERTLYLADTLGNSKPLRNFNKIVHRFEWLSDNEICLSLQDGKHLDSSVDQMAIYNIETDELSILEEFTRYKFYHDRTGTIYFIGPYKTIEGVLYYNKTEYFSDSWTENIKNSYQIVGEFENLDQLDAHIFRWGNGGLYKIDIIHYDSTLFYELAAHNYRGGALINNARTHLMHESVLINIGNKSLRGIPKDKFDEIKDADFCDFTYLSFNPEDSEILFEISCDNFESERTVADRIGIYNYLTNTLRLLSPFKDERDCLAPFYHPDGRKISFLSDGRAYIIYR
jgi:hypothetical protein